MSKGYLDLFDGDFGVIIIDNEIEDELLVVQTLSNYISYNGGLPQIFFDQALPGDPPGPVIPMTATVGNPRLYEAEDMRFFEAEDNRMFEA